MRYLIFVLISMIFYGFYSFGAKLIVKHMPPSFAAFVAYIVGAMICLGMFFSERTPIPINRFTFYACIVGVLVGIAVSSYFRALALGPVSVVVPAVACYLIIPTILGCVFLREPITYSKITGIACAILAIILLSR